MFKKRSSQTLAPMASAASYLSALSQADARARNSRTPTATPALSLSSSVTSSSEDTVLNESDSENNTDGLSLPARPPTSEQVFSTVHTEFGHCANEAYRLTSQHTAGEPVPAHVEQDPPYYILLSTYISYLILIVIGHIRDFVGKRFSPKSYTHLVPRNVSLSFIFLFLSRSVFGDGTFTAWVSCSLHAVARPSFRYGFPSIAVQPLRHTWLFP